MSPTFGNEENQVNQENSIIPADQGHPKRAKLGSHFTTKMSSQNTQPGDDWDNGSDCGTEASSSTVSARREWLKQFGRQHENTLPRSATKNAEGPKSALKAAPLRSATKSSRLGAAGNTSSAASALVNKLVSEPKKFSTPVRMKPRVQKEGVQATNEGYASVATLSQWLANDPTSTKKKRHVRRGKNVINKSRQFEKDLEDVIVIESNISRGAVSDRKKFFKDVFHGEEDSESGAPAVTRYAKSEAGAYDASSSISVSDKKDWLKRAFKKAAEADLANEATPTEESRSEIITDDAASSLSVNDKKDWLKNAFKKADSGKKTPLYAKAQSDVGHSRRNRDELASRAKRKFLERSSRTTAAKTPPKMQSPGLSKRLPPTAASTPPQKYEAEIDYRTPDKEQRSCERNAVADTRTAPPAAEPTNYVVDEDATPVDFRNARNFLIQRSRKNGHNAQVVNKVFMKKNKFEKMEQEMRRRSGPNGLLKPSWSQPGQVVGRPSHGAYEKNFVSDIAPKKSFEELP